MVSGSVRISLLTILYPMARIAVRVPVPSIVASSVEMLSGRRKKDYAAETAAQALETQAEVMGLDPVGPDDYGEGEGADTLEAADPDAVAPEAVAA